MISKSKKLLKIELVCIIVRFSVKKIYSCRGQRPRKNDYFYISLTMSQKSYIFNNNMTVIW